MVSIKDLKQSGKLPHFERLVDRDFYLSRPFVDAGAEADPAEHFLVNGRKQKTDPHRLFSTRYYLEQRPDVSTRMVNPLLHYITDGFREGTNPHPLFDEKFYRVQVPELNGSEVPGLIHYLEGGHRTHAPHPLFDRDFYLAQWEWHHARITAGKSAPAGFPSVHFSEVALIDYLHDGAARVLNPHPLFSPSYYLARCYNARSALRNAGTDPLVYYVLEGYRDGKERPHPIFDSEYYAAAVKKSCDSENLLIEYLSGGFREHSCHPLFSESFYRSKPGTEALPAHEPALVHFIKVGHTQGLSPHPMFDVEFFRRNSPWLRDYFGDPLTYFLEFGGADPHPFFDRQLCQKSNAWIEPLTEALSKYVKTPEMRDVPTSWGLAPAHAAESHQPIDRAHTFLPDVAYRSLGSRSGQEHGTVFSAEFFELNESSIGGADRWRVILTSHEASRTGAPLVILEVARRFLDRYGIKCFVFLLNDGELVPEFETVAHVIKCYELREKHSVNNFAPMVLAIAQGGPTLALCNSVDSAPLIRLISSLGVPTFTLAHEFATAQASNPGRWHMESALEASRVVIFPSAMARADAVTVMCGDDREKARKALVMHPGLMHPELLRDPPAHCKADLCNSLGLRPDTFMVLGAGSVQPRKGPDLFVTIALMVRKKYPEMNISFVWIGDPGPLNFLYSWHVREDVARAGLEERVKFPGVFPDVDAYFHSADVLLVPSRADPFPCVVTEAMAAKTPVILFDRVIGSTEALTPESGFVVPYLDLNGMAEKIAWLYDHREACVQMGAAAREIARRFDFERYFDDILAVIAADLGIRSLGENPLCAESPAARPVQDAVSAEV